MENQIKTPLLDMYAEEMGLDLSYDVIGRKNELKSLDANMQRPRMNSILLLAPAGAGKTAIVESWARHRVNEIQTFSIDLVSMGAQGENEFAARIKALVEEVIKLNEQSSRQMCLFIDEVHMLGMPNYAVGLESLKPAMARGAIKLIGATTDEEYVQHIQGNQALDQRFQRFNVSEPSDKIVFKILKDMWMKEIPNVKFNPDLANTIIEYGRFFPADSQPRKSIRLLDDMIGWHRSQGIPVNERLLDNRIYETAGVNPKWKVNIDSLMDIVKSRVKGQPYAVQQIEGSLNVAVAGLSDPKRPMGTFMFTGTTGVGKTELAKAMAQGLFGSEDHLIRFDMSEFKTRESVDLFRYSIADKINKKPYAVVLLDEIEKADPNVVDLLLQITDDGRLSNRFNRQVTFKNAYIILTTNVGHETYREAYEQGKSLTKLLNLVQSTLEKKFRPEMLGRIDAIVPFNPLTKSVRSEIAETRLTEFAQRLVNEFNIQFRLTERVQNFIAHENVNRSTSSGGGRDLNRRIKKTLYVPVAELINKEPNVAELQLDVYGDMIIENKQRRISNAWLGVSEYFVHLEDGTYIKYEGSSKEKIEATSSDAVTTILTEEEYKRHKDRLRKLIEQQRKKEQLKNDQKQKSFKKNKK